MLTIAGQFLHGWFFRDTHFKLETNDSLKLPNVQTNLINIVLIITNILYHVFSSNIYEYQ